MIDKKLEYQIKVLQELSEFWMQYQPYLSTRIRDRQFDQEKEEAFLKLKCDVALRHDVLLDVVSEDKTVRSTAQNILQIVIRSISLKKLQQKTDPELQKLEIEWHDAYLLINDTIAQLEARRLELADVSESDLRRERRKETMILIMATIRGSPWTTWVILVVILILAHVIALYGFDYDWYAALKGSWFWGETFGKLG